MEKIRELKPGIITTVTLVVLEATPRKTKASKDYLALKLSDGESQIAGNYWDWDPANTILKNVVYDVSASVAEWQGALQLNINKMTLNTNRPLADFMPSSGNDIDAVFEQFKNKASFIENYFLNNLVGTLLKELEDRWKTVPGAKTVHHAYLGGTLIHSNSVAKIAYNIAKALVDTQANTDLVIAGAMLHDIGKLFTYGVDGVTIDYTDEGQLYEHIFMGAELVGNVAENLIRSPEDERLLGVLRHIILSHHKTLEHGAVITPKCLEAYIVHYADAIDATAEQLRDAASKTDSSNAWTDKIWALDNMRHLNPNYILQLGSANSKTE